MATYPGADPAQKTNFDPNATLAVNTHTAQGHNNPNLEINAIGEDIRDTFDASTEVASAETASTLKQRIGQIMQKLKDITGETNWYNTVANSISGLLHATTGHKHTGATDDAPQIAASGLGTDAVETAKIKDDAVTTAKILDANVTFAKTDGIWWEELGATTLTGLADVITVSSLSAKRFLKILVFLIPNGTIGVGLTFNDDTGSNYARRSSTNGGADAAAGSASELALGSVNDNTVNFLFIDVVNIAAQEKLVISHSVDANTAGAANVPTRREAVGKWANTAAAINRVDIINAQAGDYLAGSKVVVLGHD